MYLRLRMNFQKELGNKIRYYRKLKKFSQEKMAEFLNVSPTFVSNFETGRAFISSETLTKIIEVLDVKPYELFLFEDIESSEILYDKILENLQTDSIKNNQRSLMLLYEFSEKLKNN